MTRSTTGALLLLAGLLGTAGCSSGVRNEFLGDQPPTVQLTHAPLNSGTRTTSEYRMNWVG